MRAEMIGGSGEKQALVFDSSKQLMWLINLDKKTYMELTKADADRLGTQMTEATAQMADQLKSMPPAQRAAIEAMMKGRGSLPGAAGAPPPVKTEYRRAGSDRVGKWACAKYEGYHGADKASELCAIEPREIGVAAADFEVARQAGEFFKKMNPQNEDRLPVIGSIAEHGFSGYPVRRVTQVGGTQMTSELMEAGRQSIPDSTFVVPEGFKKEAFPGMGR